MTYHPGVSLFLLSGEFLDFSTRNFERFQSTKKEGVSKSLYPLLARYRRPLMCSHAESYHNSRRTSSASVSVPTYPQSAEIPSTACVFHAESHYNLRHTIPSVYVSVQNIQQSAAQEDVGTLLASPAESSQLLWLAEVEHILGAASLQLAFAAASKLSAPIAEPPTEHPPMAAAPTMDATRAHRPWGYGSGPFAGISATGADIFEREWGGGAGGKDDVSNIAESDESFIIEQLEV